MTAGPSRVARFFSVQHTKTGKLYKNNHKLYQIAIKYTICPKNRQNGQKIPTSSIARPSKIELNCDFLGLEIYHLATLGPSCVFCAQFTVQINLYHLKKLNLNPIHPSFLLLK
jgi:hypothetical protein